MDRTVVVKVTTSGQISLPAAVRNRWRVSRVVVEDEGDQLMVRPIPEDPIGAACGSLKRRGSPTEAIRASERRSAGSRERKRVAQ